MNLLPKELYSKLYLARSCRRAADRARGAGNTRGREYDEIRRIEIGPIQQVKDLRSKLQAQPLIQSSVFHRREIPGGEPWAQKSISSQVAKETAVSRRLQKRLGVKPLTRLTNDCRAGEVRIDKRPHRIARIPIVRWVVTQLRCERESGLQNDKTVHRPATHGSVAKFAQAA